MSSSKQWLREHAEDMFVKRAQREGFRSRAVYKLMEIDRRDQLFMPGMTVVDLGAAPGGWSQYAQRRVGADGLGVAIDILAMEPIPGVEFIQGDFTEQTVLDQLLTRLAGQPVDLVLSDMAPNISGIAATDQARAMYLVELALDLCGKVLRSGGVLLAKTFQGEGYQEFHNQLKQCFRQVLTRKPQASRARSRENYLLAKGFLG